MASGPTRLLWSALRHDDCWEGLAGLGWTGKGWVGYRCWVYHIHISLAQVSNEFCSLYLVSHPGSPCQVPQTGGEEADAGGSHVRIAGTELGRDDPNWGEIAGDMAMLELVMEELLTGEVEERLLDDQHKQSLTLHLDMLRPSTHYQQTHCLPLYSLDPPISSCRPGPRRASLGHNVHMRVSSWLEGREEAPGRGDIIAQTIPPHLHARVYALGGGGILIACLLDESNADRLPRERVWGWSDGEEVAGGVGAQLDRAKGIERRRKSRYGLCCDVCRMMDAHRSWTEKGQLSDKTIDQQPRHFHEKSLDCYCTYVMFPLRSSPVTTTNAR